MDVKNVVKVPFEVVQKVVKVSKFIAFKKETEVWKDKGKSRNFKYRGKHRINAKWCLGCGLCARMCPTQCIKMVPTGLKKPKALPQVAASHCIFCGFCEDVCPAKPQKAIVLTSDYDIKIKHATWETLSNFVFKPENEK